MSMKTVPFDSKNPQLASDDLGAAGRSDERLSDADWESAVARVKEAVDHYPDLDIRALAEQGAREFLNAREALAAGQLGMRVTTSLAQETTVMMFQRLEERHSTTVRFKRFMMTCLLFLLPVLIIASVIAAGRAFIGWSVVPNYALYVGYGFLVLFTLALGAGYVLRGTAFGARQRLLTSVCAGLLAVLAASPPVMQMLRENERALLMATTLRVERRIAEYLAAKEAGVPTPPDSALGDQKLSVRTQKTSDSDMTYTFDTPGMPGVLRADVSTNSGKVYWSGIGTPARLEARVALGALHQDKDGVLTLETASTVYGPLRVDPPGMVPVQGRVAAVLDAKGERLLASQPVVGLGQHGDKPPGPGPAPGKR